MNSRYQTVARVAGGQRPEADLHDFQLAPHDIAYITAYNPIRCDLARGQGRRRRSDHRHGDPGDRHEDRSRALGMAQPRPRRRRRSRRSKRRATATRGIGFTSTRSTPQPDGDSSYRRAARGRATSSKVGSGRVLWRLGGLESSFKMGPGTETAWQHDGRVLPDGEVTLLRRRLEPADPPPVARGADRARLQDPRGAAGARLRAPRTRRCSPRARATCRRCADGNVAGGLRRRARDQRVLQRAARCCSTPTSPIDMSFYRAFRYPWSGRPLTPPAVLATLNNTGEETIVHMSWNGASEVASWRILAGATGGPLAARATIPDGGFESSVTLPRVRARRRAGARRGRAAAGDLADGRGRSASPPRSRRLRDDGGEPSAAARAPRGLQ